MNRSPKFKEENEAVMLEFMQAHGFALLCTGGETGLQGTHVPVRVTQRGGDIVITGHLSLANPQAGAVRSGEAGLLCFLGPHAYISPTQYLRPSAPTWNYQAVHAHVRLHSITDPVALEEMLRDMVSFYEPTWLPQMAAMDRTQMEGMLRGIIGFEAVVVRLEGQFKLSQNKLPEERANIISWLAQQADPVARQLGEVMAAREAAQAAQ